MQDDLRPDPDELLNALNKPQGGNLRIFLGMSAGVGKTYAMLKAAHQKQREGVDVVIGVVETHGRVETSALVDGLPIIPRIRVDYRGTELEEMDLNAILKRKPKLVIVDELAHSNIPGSRHEKRYQDVYEILDAGIDVFTALNVQHLESRKDSVESITSIAIRETVPDGVLERANQIELVDISPNELLKRLREGKVYLGEKAQKAEQNFFKEDKLTALREIALRITAERVDKDLQKFSTLKSDKGPWNTNERLLVAFSHSPYSEKLIRATRRLAYNLEAPWIALHVDTGITLGDLDQMQLAKNTNLAKELNAELITTTEADVFSAIRRVCRQKNVTQVIVGRPTRRWFRDLIEGGRLLDRLVSKSHELDIHVIRHEGSQLPRPRWIEEISYYQTKTGALAYWYSLWFIIAVSFFGYALEPWMGYQSVGFIFLLGVVAVGVMSSLGAVIVAATLSAFVWNFFFIPPKFTFAITKTEDFLMCIAFFVIALIVGFLTNRIRFHEKVIRDREERTYVLYQILQDITSSQNKSEFLKKVAERTGNVLGGSCGVVLKSSSGKLDFSNAKEYSLNLTEKEQAVAQWSFEKNKPSGWSTDTLSESRSLYLPLYGASEIVGVFIFKPDKKAGRLDLEKENLLHSIVRQLGGAIERHFLMKRLAEAQRLKDSEALHQTLLNSISHEMRTPLTAIMGSASALENEAHLQDQNNIASLAQNIHEAGERLNRVIENLLDMSRLNSGVLALNLDWHDMSDLTQVIVKKLEKVLKKHSIRLHSDSELILCRVDHRLMEHAISNILINAAMYTPENSKIEVFFKNHENSILIEIQDEGPGIPEESLEKIFNKFYRVPGSPTGGTGLGLSIAKSIIELHKGSLFVENRQPHGARFTIQLPFEQPPSLILEKV